MPDAPCHFVIERATEGRCETCGHDYTWHSEYGPDRITAGQCTFLGPVVKRCGHEEAGHITVYDWLDLEDDTQSIFGDGDWHAYKPPPTEEAS